MTGNRDAQGRDPRGNELGAFLRARREALTPEQAGLPPGTRRRTPGLRRTELALLAGISVEYLARLEQGRDRNPSPQVLGALCDALQLPHDDRAHLRRLLKAADSAFLCSTVPQPAREARPTVRRLLDRLEPTPAVVLNWFGDVVAYTRAYERVMRPLGLLDAEQPSMLRYLFTDPRARRAFPDWDEVADRLVAALHFDLTKEDPALADLVAELSITAGAAFTDRIAAPIRITTGSGVERLAHPTAGALRFSFEALTLPESDGQYLLVQLPADEATATALDRLEGRGPGVLRAVGD
ncbi:XRE family transcriptional regulator [Streptomyces triticagri]|uniref:XRE family transcriptional regulator n=1 Tax=Streptomyces triticagri TaxID=2293568 RepID=A0A372MB38_9ACTN|nr:helix-turn-helix transcriptional regulator [Streptomyces triticagri]RFU88111.1 XRE family transcriptional regulator [Streptomyces triticagri]